MDVNDFLQQLQRRAEYRDQIVHIRKIEARTARYGELTRPLPAPVVRVLESEGISQLFSHQAEALERARAGEDLIVVTGTASGKTLCYNLPVAETLLADTTARAMYIFPTKALAHDQLAGLQRWSQSGPELAEAIKPACYDGDTASSQRAKIRRKASVILTNPDMLHQGILPYHAKWAEFLSNLRYLVIDELHVYRGIFGSHVANVLRRLQRVLDFHGADCRIICCSATIGNPRELAGALTGRELGLIDQDGSPCGTKYFVLWNPPYVDASRVMRRSANIEAKRIFTELIRSGVQSIVFTRARVVAELICKYAVQEFTQSKETSLARRIKPYRGGFLPQERRQIEKELFSGKLLGVCTTTALELGIDVGALDAAVLVGFPGTISSAWQQAGRAGRRSDESLAVLVAYNDPIDQYIMHHPEYFFSRDVEHAIIDPENVHILLKQLACAAFELPLTAADAEYFGSKFSQIIARLVDEDQLLTKIVDRWYFASTQFPSGQVNLRTISQSTFAIVNRSADGNEVIGSVDSISAPEQLYPGAVYLHEGQGFLVRQLDLAGEVAYVEPADVDYYTQPVLASHSKVLSEEASFEGKLGKVGFGELKVVWQTVAFKKIKFYTMEMIGQVAVDLPAQELDTRGFWLVPDEHILGQVSDGGFLPIQALCGLRNLMIWALPILAMCDSADIGAQVSMRNFPRPGLMLYDRYLGGLGFAHRGFEQFRRLIEMVWQIVSECECEAGCPSCVGLPQMRPPIHQDPDLQGGADIPDKEATALLIELIRRCVPDELASG